MLHQVGEVNQGLEGLGRQRSVELVKIQSSPVANTQVMPRRQDDSLEVCNTIKSIPGASIGSNISAEAIYTEPLHKKSMGTNVQEAVLKIAHGPPGAPQPVPPVMDSLKTRTESLSARSALGYQS